MKYRIITLFLILSQLSQLAFGQKITNPESVVYDKVKDRYIVSDPGGPAIIAIASNGTKTILHEQGLFFPRGATIVGNMLFVNDLGKVLGFDLTTDQLVIDTIIPGAQGLNDIVADDKGNLYMSDDVLNQIFKFEIADTVGYAWITAGIDAPNGMYFDKANNRLVLVSFIDDSPIQAINLTTKAVSTIKNTTLDLLDGIAVDKNGNYYISSWGTNKIYRYNSNFDWEKEFSTGHDGPADILFVPEKDLLAVPNMNKGTIDFIPVSTVSVKENLSSEDYHVNVYASPAKDEIILDFTLEKPAVIGVELVNVSAKTTQKIASETFFDGVHEIGIPTDGKKGVFIVRLIIDGKPVVRKVNL
ncbi:MAG: hypothetical protein GX437_11980 [Sphingobacteriales bacterium]|nr:hypothetical protein [Sphingobacteriales bacterium]